MNKFSVRLMGLKETRKALKDEQVRGIFTAEEFTEIAGERVKAVAQDMIENYPKTGIVYYRATGPHQASAPGEAPADDTGALVASLEVNMVAINQYAFSAVVGSELHYAEELEFFGPNYDGNARPFLRPAVDLVEAEVGYMLADTWNRYRV